MKQDIQNYNNTLKQSEKEISEILQTTIDSHLKNAQNKIWHGSPVWFLDGNPIVGYSSQKAGLRLMFWSGADFDEPLLKIGTGKFKDASIFYTDVSQVNDTDLKRWLKKATEIQWNYKDIVKNKGKLFRLQERSLS